MKYKYKKNQIFGKRIKVPKEILLKIYNKSLSFNEYVEYKLEDKIPVECLCYSDMLLLNKFGIEKLKKLDWELLNKSDLLNDYKNILMTIDVTNDNINQQLYELIKDSIMPKNYSNGMKNYFSDSFFSDNELDDNYEIKNKFNNGELSIQDIINNWDVFKNKKLDYYLKNDSNNTFNINDSMFKQFINRYYDIAYLIQINHNVYSIINSVINSNGEDEEKNIIKKNCSDILYNSTGIDYFHKTIDLSNQDFERLFMYYPLIEYVSNILGSENRVYDFLNITKHDSKEYLFNSPIPFNVLINPDVTKFVSIYGIKNIIDFDNECGHFFTSNNCYNLKIMYDIFVKYGNNERDLNKSIFIKDIYNESRGYTKEEFYEAMKRMIKYGPTTINDDASNFDYRFITGKFREKYDSLFISEDAPDDLKRIFYSKKMSPSELINHSEYVKYIRGKDMSSYFKEANVDIYSGKDVSFNQAYSKIQLGEEPLYYKTVSENFYLYLDRIMNEKEKINFIIEYGDILEIIFNDEISKDNNYKLILNEKESKNSLEKKICNLFERLICEKGYNYPNNIPDYLKNNYSFMFLPVDSPQRLQDEFYSRSINSNLLLENPDYLKYLKSVDNRFIFKYMKISSLSAKNVSYDINLVSCINSIVGKDKSLNIMLSYEKYLNILYDLNKLNDLNIELNYNEEMLLSVIDENIYKEIVKGNIKYDNNMPDHFKKKYPSLFLNNNISKDIIDKFYNRKLSLIDFNDNPELINNFDDVNIVCGFDQKYSWLIPVFDNKTSRLLNLDRIKVISVFSKIEDPKLSKAFQIYITGSNNINLDKIEYAADILLKLSLSNSSEIYNFKETLAVQILYSENPLETLNRIENIFIKNNIPIVGKVYSCFEILHPDFKGINFNASMMSPILKKASNRSKKYIIFSDLIKSFFASNNRSVNNYLKNIETATNIYYRIKKCDTNITDEEKNELLVFRNHLKTLYDNALLSKKDTLFIQSDNIIKDIDDLVKRLSLDDSVDYNIGDRIIRMFCHYVGFNTLDDAKKYINDKINNADKRNRVASKSNMVIKKGYFVKGIGKVDYLSNILQNGSVSKEYLGAYSSSDATPLDTDISLVTIDSDSNEEMIDSTVASKYGPIYFVLKNDDRFDITRTEKSENSIKYDSKKIEAFYTGVCGIGHYGIRTGFASSEIDYIVVDKYDPKIGLEIAMNGFYIPVALKNGEIVFKPNEYDELRSKMNGLSYYNDNDYKFSNNLYFDGLDSVLNNIENSNENVMKKKSIIYSMIKDVLNKYNLILKEYTNDNLMDGIVELIDTGSTGRGTNKPNDGDFDFMMRLDKSIFTDQNKLNDIKESLLKSFGKYISCDVTMSGDFRLKSVPIDNDSFVDIDISFVEKTDKIKYSTDMSLKDRLNTIKTNDPKKYDLVVANIIYAKNMLKKEGVYKPNRGELPQGGLGGVGIENWILQNGGSFYDAAIDFINHSEGKNFEEFKQSYYIWDFGENYLSIRKNVYMHDNFVSNNMSEEGYIRMKNVLNDFIKNYNNVEVNNKNNILV